MRWETKDCQLEKGKKKKLSPWPIFLLCKGLIEIWQIGKLKETKEKCFSVGWNDVNESKVYNSRKTRFLWYLRIFWKGKKKKTYIHVTVTSTIGLSENFKYVCMP